VGQCKVLRSCPCQIFASLTSVMVTQEAHIIPQLGRRHGLLVNMNNTLRTASGCGLIPLTQYASLLSTPSPFMTILQISEWVVAPYKKPECNMPDNKVFKNYVSMVQIRSEHAISFLKGQFALLKDLHINISNEKLHRFAMYQIASCVGLHAFAMMCEDDKHPHDQNTTDRQDPFIDEGLSSLSDLDNNRLAAPCPRSSRRLQAGKAHCE
jgi:hypothetical protein